uniref:Uncharacterized protein n=1 Tax=Arundo donax TaxID=35708 RepID=A0A0A9GX96_ARUDO
MPLKLYSDFVSSFRHRTYFVRTLVFTSSSDHTSYMQILQLHSL